MDEPIEPAATARSRAGRGGDPPRPSALRKPRGQHEEVLCSLFAQVLGINQVSVDDSFFALGGHSLLASRLITRIASATGTDLPLHTLFTAPTVRQLAAALDEATGAARARVRRYSRPEPIPLSPMQRRLWFLSRLHGSTGNYNLPIAYRLRGRLDVSALQQALNDLAERHESLRTAYPDWDGRPQQVVLDCDEARVELPVVAVAEKDLSRALSAAARVPFDLTAETPLRAALYRVGPDEHVLLLVIHHIACDGWSMAPMLEDVADAYTARRLGGAPAWAALPVQYVDYTLWHLELLGDPGESDSLLRRQIGFWRDHLDGIPDKLRIDIARARPDAPTHRGGRTTAIVPPTTHQALQDLAGTTGTSIFMIVCAALAALLSKHGAGTDIAVGTPTAGRGDEQLDCLVGFFVNTLVVRAKTDGDPAFHELLRQVRDSVLSALAHQDVPFDHVVQALNPQRSTAWHPLVQVMLAFQNTTEAAFTLPGVSAVPETVEEGYTRFDLRFEVVERFADRRRPAGMSVSLTYALDLFAPRDAEQLAREFAELLATVTEEPDLRLSELDKARSGKRVVPAGTRAERSEPPQPGAIASKAPRLVFVFSPYGQQWVGMGRRLFRDEPSFRHALNHCDAALARHIGWSVVAELFRDEPEIRAGDVGVMQPAVFAIQVGIAEWLRAYGVVPDAVVGHSLGEIAACVVAGLLELPDAARLVVHYSEMQRRVAGPEHGMAVFEMSAQELADTVRALGGSVVIAAENGPRTTVLSGSRTKLADLVTELRARDVLCALIRVDVAAHGPAMEVIVADLEHGLTELRAQAAHIPMISTVTCEPLDAGLVTPAYFAQNLRQRVRLAEATRKLLANHDVLVEISANPVLAPALQQSVDAFGGSARVITTMRNTDEALTGLADTVDRLWRLGVRVVSPAGIE